MDLNIFQSHSLKARVTLFSLTIFVLSIWALALFASRMLRADMQQQLGDQQLASVTGVAAGISHKLEERLVALDQVAERMDPALLRHDAALQEFLEAQPVFRGLFNAGVIVTTLDGTVSHAVPFAKERIGVTTLAIGAIAAALRQGRTTVGQPVMDKALPAPLITMAAPIRNPQGQVIGALAGMINLTLPNLLDPISQGRYGKTGSYLLVARPARMVITNTDKKRVMEAAPAPGVNRLIDRFMQGYEGSAIFVDPFEVETLTSAKGITLADWYVAAALPTAEAFAPIDAMQRRIVLATVLLTLLAGGLTWWMLRRQLAPLLATAETLVALPTAQTFPIALPVAHPDEIGHLIDGFNHLLAHLHQRETLLKQILDTSSAAIFVIDSQGRITQANQRMAEMFGCPLDTLIGHDYVSLVHPAERNVGQQNMLALLANKVSSSDLERLYWRADESEFWGHLACRGFHDASTHQHCFVGVITDITERIQVGKFEQLRSRILELLASGEPLPLILEALVRGVEQLNPTMLCSILLLSGDGQHLGQGVAPSLPDFYNAAIDGIEIGAGAGSCGTSAFTAERVIVSDIATHVYWQRYKELAARADLGACWSQPILSSLGQVLGTFASYHHTTHTPTSAEIASVERFARIAAIVIEGQAAAKKMRDSEERFRTLIEESPAAILVHRELRIIYLNPAAIAMFGARTAQELVGKALLDLIHPDSHQVATARVRHITNTGHAAPLIDEKYLRLDGTPIDVEVQSTSIIYEGLAAIRTAFRDISERKLAHDKLQLAANVFSHAREGIAITDARATIIDVNEAFCRITGYSRDEVLGQNPRVLGSGRQDKAFYAAMWHDLGEQGHWYGEIWNRRKNGELYPEMLTISAVRTDQGQVQNYVALFSDISAIKAHQHELEHIAHFDALTNLPNRVLLADRLQQAMAQAQRRGQMLALAYLDLDGFKAINDRHGHEAGDLLLMTVATRMKQTLREGDTLARIGGDEFVAVLLDLSDSKASAPMLSRLLAAAAEPVRLGDLALQVSASLGVTFYPQVDEMEADQLLRQADQAMYQAKLAGKNRYHFFDAAQDRSARGHHESLERIRQALDRREFVLYYQPKVNMRTGAVIGAEALIRWQHPEKGLLAPALFLPVIEDHPLAVDIGEWVIATALIQNELWQADGLDMPISVNVGARQLQQADFVPRLRELLAAQPGVKPFQLEIEVLETSALEDWVGVSQSIEECREMGVLFALDDFGTGYSSLTYLKRLQVDLLKIDQSFVRDMLDDPDDMAILQGVIGLAGAFRRNVIAEGVETIAHGTLLLQLGCDLGQGFGIARPMPADLFPAWAASWQRDAAWVAAGGTDHPSLMATLQ
ncbi:diguanylate cyclase/phosphodiesterase with PAS/PAC and GAF sensor(s) [Rhodoferax ferrireducens T118]|uniref:Diguanylate cyclase/phosphodiesterase with PAS/PAC and GAF sensor(S) n=1 Tax=Albidiferax ferrireducens (strain ATCC BAA-621 / DSM 15236 / T118) TaxID=338969 RepID=Q21WZ5_ALBFT|nr:EAL domain-containing protein [Rhodoferax ferrireducens]ABD69708.1 diguanylate cyclase/phosphodiesterase with PAS/PAC and GAF sensor(s) [Rhodoferax ferrireducens T118]